MWIEIGHFAALLALLTAVTQCLAGTVGGLTGAAVWSRVGRQAAFAGTLLLTLASFSLIHAFLTHDFSVAYVANQSSLKLPLFYLATAMWGGHEGSLLLWAWLLSLFISLAAWRHFSTHPVSMPWVLAILGLLLAGFLLLVLFLSSPFERLFPPPMDGRDLNPLLQDPGMVFHPPFLYMGYVGFAIPYAFAMAALITGRAGEEWILATRRWTLFSWAMLTTGIVFGAYWAYYELGWGGYWAWDPVENASFMPWLTGTAFFHSVMVQERRQTFKVWNLFLIITTFALSLLGTFLVRSGVLSSVHAFATDPGRGVYILVFMSVVLLMSFGLLVFRAERLQGSATPAGVISKESAFLFNNLFFVVAGATVLLGTLYPLAMETLGNAKVSVGAPYYNKVFVPIMLGMLLLMGVGPVLSWGQSSLARLRAEFMLPGLAGLLVAAGAYAGGVRHPMGALTVGLILFVLITHGRDLLRGVAARRNSGDASVLRALGRLLLRNRRRYGGLTVHLGILVMCAGFIGSGMFQTETSLVLKNGDAVNVAGWQFTFRGVGTAARHNWQALEATVDAERDGEVIVLKPQIRNYGPQAQDTTEAAIHSDFWGDLYVVLGEQVSEGAWTFRIYRNPLIGWVWWGTFIMAGGTLWSLMQGRRLRRRGEA
ncbi:MAG: heme lyase CcmF/NrfE family subunit [Magnetococcus sp. WYHC-3]